MPKHCNVFDVGGTCLNFLRGFAASETNAVDYPQGLRVILFFIRIYPGFNKKYSVYAYRIRRMLLGRRE